MILDLTQILQRAELRNRDSLIGLNNRRLIVNILEGIVLVETAQALVVGLT